MQSGNQKFTYDPSSAPRPGGIPISQVEPQDESATVWKLIIAGAGALATAVGLYYFLNRSSDEDDKKSKKKKVIESAWLK